MTSTKNKIQKTIIFIMRNAPRQIPSLYRQSLSTLTSDPSRTILSTGLYRQSLGTMRFKTSIDIDMSDRFLRDFVVQETGKEKGSLVSLKSTLSRLEKKINKAKKQLNTHNNIISQDQEEQAEPELPHWAQKFDQKRTIIYEQTAFSSMIRIVPSLPQSYNKNKSYYLSQLAPALQGHNPKMLDHFTLSHKILKNAHRIDSPTFGDLQQRKINIVRRQQDKGKKTLLIDIDETLLHCHEDSQKPFDFEVSVPVQEGGMATAYVSIRPYAISFLKKVGKHYQIIGYTASHQSYADVVLDQIDPQHVLIKHRLYRHNCIELHSNIFAKDLRIINRDLSQMVLVDNAPYSYIFQLQNGIPIIPYYSGEDNQLVGLEKYLQELAKEADVREFNKRRFKFHRYGQFQDVGMLANELYFGY